MNVYTCEMQYCELPCPIRTYLPGSYSPFVIFNQFNVSSPVSFCVSGIILRFAIIHVFGPPLKSRYECVGNNDYSFPQFVSYRSSQLLTNHMLITSPIKYGSHFVHPVPCFTLPLRIPRSNPNSRKFDRGSTKNVQGHIQINSMLNKWPIS